MFIRTLAILVFTGFCSGSAFPQEHEVVLEYSGTVPANPEQSQNSKLTEFRMCTGSVHHAYCVDEKSGVYLVNDLNFSTPVRVLEPADFPDYFFTGFRIPFFSAAVDHSGSRLYVMAAVRPDNPERTTVFPSGNDVVDSHKVILEFSLDPRTGEIIPCDSSTWCREVLRLEQNSQGHAGGALLYYSDPGNGESHLLVSSGDNVSAFEVPDGGKPAQRPETVDASIFAVNLESGRTRLKAYGVRNAHLCDQVLETIFCTNIGWEYHESVYRLSMATGPGTKNFCWGQHVDGAFDTQLQKSLVRSELQARACAVPAAVFDRSSEPSSAMATFVCSTDSDVCLWADVVTGKIHVVDYRELMNGDLVEPAGTATINVSGRQFDNVSVWVNSDPGFRADPRLFSLSDGQRKVLFLAIEKTGDVYRITMP